MVISNHFSCRDLVHHPIETTINKKKGCLGYQVPIDHMKLNEKWRSSSHPQPVVIQGQLFEKIDSNQDGELSRTELQVSFLMFFF